MKLEKILDKLGSLEKNSFIKIIDNIIVKKPKNSIEIDKILSSGDKTIKSVDNQNIVKIFSLIKDEFKEIIKSEFRETQSQFDILIDIIIKDGNCILKQDWFSRLYEKQLKVIKDKTKSLTLEMESEKTEMLADRRRDYKIYKSCLETAYENDVLNNRDKKITSDEHSILLTLSKELDLSQEEVKLINYSIIPIKKLDIQEVINNLKNIGVIFFSKKDNTIYIPDEVVSILRESREKQVADKYFRRTLKALREPVINQIAKKHGIDRKLSITEKIEEIISIGVSFSSILKNDIYKDGLTITEKKKELNELFEETLGIQNLKGSTLEDKILSLQKYYDGIEKDESIGISLDGYEKLLNELNETLPSLNRYIRQQFEFQEEVVLYGSFLLDYNIKPRDILDLISKDDLIKFLKERNIKQRGDNISNILEHYKDTENLLLENYENIGFRNINALKDNGIVIKEAELGLKFEELTKFIFQKLGFNVDEKLKNKLNTPKDKIDILINLDGNEVILVECKTNKEIGYNKFSMVSRQLKSYQNLLNHNGLRVNKVLLIAPDFSDDFITDCEIDTEINISLITAPTLIKINEAFKVSKHKVFPHILFRDVIINEQRILKALEK
ncbi:MAG TPA: hypothetical protein PKD51_10530 [Saprospiraceae bacterium]|nr:hypothetical protein [Saprospiraceae bacterium]